MTDTAPLRALHVCRTQPTLEPDPAGLTRMRQTAFCGWCAPHRPDDDSRWPCQTTRLLDDLDALRAENARLRGAVERYVAYWDERRADWESGDEARIFSTSISDDDGDAALRAALAAEDSRR